MLLITAAKLLLALASFQDPTPQTPGPMMWTGEMRSTDETFDGIPLIHIATAAERANPAYQSILLGQLNALVAKTEVQRNFSQVIILLDVLRAQACWSSAYPGKAKVVAEITQTRADWLERLGRHAEAIYAANHALVQFEEKDKAPYDRFTWVASNGALAELVNDIDALPQMVVLHKRFPSDAPATKGGDAIDDAVRHECLEGNQMTLTNFGTRCVPALVRILRENPRQMNERNPVDSGAQPLGVLMLIDRAAASRLLLSTLGTRGPDWTLRAIFCLSNQQITKQGLVASTDPYSPSTSSDPLTLQVVDALAREGMPAPRLFSLLEPLVGNDIVSPDVREFLLHQVQATDSNILSPLRSMLDGVRVGPNKRALYEAFLESPDPELRGRCARALASYDVGPATLRAAEHSDANVRQAAARALVRHVVWPYDYQHNTPATDKTGRWLEVQRTPEIAAALMKLAHDPEKSVRVTLANVLRESLEEPAADLLEVLISDAEPEVRQMIAGIWDKRPELQARIVERLASDTNAGVLDYVGHTIAMSASKQFPELQAKFELLLPAIAILLQNPAAPFGRSSFNLDSLIDAAMQTPKGARTVVDACARGPQSELLLQVVVRVVHWGKGKPEDVLVYDLLDAPRLAELYAFQCEFAAKYGNSPDFLTKSIADAIKAGEVEPQPFFALARDEKRAPDLRLRALRCVTSMRDPALKSFVLEFLRSLDSAGASKGGSGGIFNLLAEALLPWPGLAEARTAICTDAKVKDTVALYAASLASKAPALDAAATRACLQRWSRLDEDGKLWSRGILAALDPHADAGVLELWKQLYRDPVYIYGVVDAMARYPADESVPLLADCVASSWLSGKDNAEIVRANAIAALTTRLDELGADALLKAIATAPSDDTRKKCFDGLEQIRKYQDEKQNWQTRRNGTAARDAAVAELLPMLEDSDPAIRASAARSLATLRATEHLPRLVRLLKDKEPAVRDAAQKALDALNAPEAKKP